MGGLSVTGKIQQIDAHKIFGGQQLRFLHTSETLNCEMNFSVFLPSAAQSNPVPVIYWLSGLTCTDENFVSKAGAQRYAEVHGVALIAPDTSPRGEGVPDDPEAAYDFGLGAGFYVDAQQPPWNRNYRMYSYVVDELPSLLSDLPVDSTRASIMGHSMGGHGALSIALKNASRYQSISAFAPICSPLQCPWGEKALSNYIGDDREQWRQYDSCALIREASGSLPMLVDQGDADAFLADQLKIDLLQQAVQDSGYPATIRIQPGYDHSYFFIATFIEDHIKFHARHLY